MVDSNGSRQPSLAASLPPSPVDARPRRDSIVSLPVSPPIDREQLALALDKIHTSASQSDALTTFNDFAPPPGSLPVPEPKSTATEIVQQGLSGLYSRLKEAVGAVSKSASSHEAVGDGDNYEAGTRSTTSPSAGTSKAPFLPRGEGSGSSSSTLEPVRLSSDTHTSGAMSASSQTHLQSSSKASSIATTTSVTAKLSSPALQGLSKLSKAVLSVTANPAVAPVTVQGQVLLDKEAARGITTHVDDVSVRPAGRRSISKPTATVQSPILSANGSLDSISTIDRIMIPARTTRDEALSTDGGADTPRSPVQSSVPERRASAAFRLAPLDVLRRPAVIDRLAFPKGSSRSRSSSMEPGTTEASPISTSAHSSLYHESFTQNERPQILQSGIIRIPGTTTNEGASDAVSARLERMRKQVLSKEFWMADETCKECFRCGAAFTAFRRKHHCRTCGCIFDSKCTSQISGQKFGVQGSLRVCKTCLDVINRRYDSASDDSADESYLPAIFRTGQAKHTPTSVKQRTEDEGSTSERTEQTDQADDGKVAVTPMMAIPATRRVGNSNRNSAVLEIDLPQLSRPSSSRSLKSLAAGRPQSSGHRRHHSKHNFLTRLKGTMDDRAPFRAASGDEVVKKANTNAFHDDNIIDPDLAEFMSDDSSDDEQVSDIYSVMKTDEFQPGSVDPDRASFGNFMGSGRKHRFRQGDKSMSISGLSHINRGYEEGGGLQSLTIHHGRPLRRRNLSIASASIHHLRSPRPKSAVAKGPTASADALSVFDAMVGDIPGLKRTESTRNGQSTEGGLNPASWQHVKKLFRQLLDDDKIPNPESWEKALLPIIDQCADDVDPDIRSGDVMDIRHWVKFKKIPGGKPSDTAYVHGVVFTKNLALKSMPRRIRNPRIVIITFPLEYQRHPEQHFMSLQPVIEQEKEYLRMVVNRILNLEPNVLLVEKGVAGVALQYLAEANVAVAYNVKPSVIEAVARIVNMPVISSMDMLSLGARVGTCENFEVKTFVNNDIRGRKKTYIFISGCPKDRGCTIALRGASTEILARMKRITEFMVYVVYNLKLETCLMRDEFVQIPTELDSLMSADSSSTQTSHGLLPVVGPAPNSSISSSAFTAQQSSTEPSDRSPTNMNAGNLSSSDSTGANSELSTSEITAETILRPAVQQPAVEEVNTITSAQDSQSPLQVPEDIPMPAFYSDMVAKYETRILSVSPFVRFTQPYLLMKAREQERRLEYLKRLRDQDQIQEPDQPDKPEEFQLIKPEMIHQMGQKAPRKIMEVIHAVHDAEYDKALHNYLTQTKQWETYLQNCLDLFDPYAHQNIVVLSSVTCTATQIPCVEPALMAIEFYNQHPDEGGFLDQDFTLGQYIEDICDTANYVCTANNCGRKMYEHHRTFVHDNARLTIILKPSPQWPENFPEKPQERGGGDDEGTGICMWNYCKVCDKHFGLMPMSVSTWKYSFGKYLELSFWNTGLRLHPETGCPHDHKKDHVRYFYYTYLDIAVKVHYDPIDLYEIIVPRKRITWKVDIDLKLKNDVFTKAEERWNRFINSVKARLKSIKIDSVLPEKAEDCKAEVDRLLEKAEEDHKEMIKVLQNAYMNSKYYEIIPFNVVFRQMLERATEWDSAFTQFESKFLSDKDVRQLTLIQLKKMFSDHEKDPTSTDGTTVGSESEEKMTPVTSPNESSDVGEKLSPSSEESSVPQLPEKTTQQEQLSQPSELGDSQSHEELLSPSLTTQPITNQKEEDSVKAEEQPDAVKAGEAEAQIPSAPRMPTSTSVSEVGAKGIKPPSNQPAGFSSSAGVANSPTLSRKSTIVSHSSPTEPSSAAKTSHKEPSLSEKVEQIRRQNRAHANTSSGSGAEAPTETTSPFSPDRTMLPRRTGTNVSPPMLRTFGQQSGTVSGPLPRTQSTIGKLLRDQKVAQEAAASTDAQKGQTGDDTLKGDKKFLGTLKPHRKAGPSNIPRFVHNKRDSRVSKLAYHFEQLSREFEKERLKDRKQRATKLHHTRAFLPRSSTKTIVEVYRDVDQAVQEPGPSDEDHLGRESSEKQSVETSTPDITPTETQNNPPETEPSSPASPPSQERRDKVFATTEAETEENKVQEENRVSTDDEAGSDVEGTGLSFDDILPDVNEIAESLEQNAIPEELPKHQKKSLMDRLANFWAERSASSWPQLEYPVNMGDHVMFDSDVIVREDEPSSLVAYAMSLNDYKEKLAAIRRDLRMSNFGETDVSGDSLEDNMGTPVDPEAAKERARKIDMELEKTLLRSTGTHVKYQFVHGTAKMMCKIFFAEQFDALRRKCGAADRFVESLSRCLKWDSKGGKTKSVFLKTLDDRFVLKSLSVPETQSFLKFAPDYFNIMAEALFHELPSVIAKMLGFFRVHIKNPVTNTDIKLDLLVMENLFYDRTPSRTFDLKGSMRNRRIQSTGERDEVLLDENMVEYIYESPLFAREHSKRLLRASVFNDTLFLAKQDVMDYSLMVAVDEAKKELVVGIIDCIRTYTWDKQLESWIKQRGLAGGSRNRPTVTSPKEYKSRFRVAMAK